MSMRTVYIRKENEETFDSLTSKSDTINAILEQIRKKKGADEPDDGPSVPSDSQ